MNREEKSHQEEVPRREKLAESPRGKTQPEERGIGTGRKISFVLVSFTGCNGCMSSLLCDPIFFSLLQDSDFRYFPLVLDPFRTKIESKSGPKGKKNKASVKESPAKDGQIIKTDLLADLGELGNIDIALIEGSIYAEEHIRAAEILRNKAKTVIAFGTCACFGGITSYAQDALQINNKPLNNVIAVDDFIPGCPPTSNSIGNAIVALSRGEPITHATKTLCEECPLKTEITRAQMYIITRLRPKRGERISHCFLTEGMLCLGPVTRTGCGHRCIHAGQPCDGCYGPMKGESVANIVNFLATMHVIPELKEYNGIFFKYSHPAGLFPEAKKMPRVMKQEEKAA